MSSGTRAQPSPTAEVAPTRARRGSWGDTSEKHKASLDYLLTLMASSSNKEYVAFDSMGKVTSI